MSIAPSPAELRVYQIKEQVVLQLYLREGSFWDAVRAIRSKWEIMPAVGLPPLDLPAPRPNEDPFDVRYGQWPSDVTRLRLEIGRGRFYRAADWERFAAGCVLYDPPEGRDLLAFAEYGGINAQRADRRDVFGEDLDDESAHAVAPLVKWVPNQAQSQMKMQRYYEAIITRLIERFVEPTGKDGAEALDEIIQRESLDELMAAPVDRKPCIFPDEHSTRGEVLAALSAIRSDLIKGRPPTNDLVAAVCAFLQDDDNCIDSQDRRRKRYTQEKLAEEFEPYGVNSKRSVRGHVKRGRELRAIREKNLKES